LESYSVKWMDETQYDKRYVNWKVSSFDMTYKLSELGFVQITNDDLGGATMEFRQKLKSNE
jgi:hypothetical protein